MSNVAVHRYNAVPSADHGDVYHAGYIGTIDGAKIYAAHGDRIRGKKGFLTKHIDFTMGGHDKVYDYVAKGEILIDKDLSPLDKTATIYHEVFERRLMAKGWSYEAAHEAASAAEVEFRKTLDITVVDLGLVRRTLGEAS